MEQPLTEKRVVEIVLVELEQYRKAMGQAIAHAIALNNAKILEQLKEEGVVR